MQGFEPAEMEKRCLMNIDYPCHLPDVHVSLWNVDDFEDILVASYCVLFKSLVCAGPSTVGIDNKIEAAMDLVKSHLMAAVREEVEVLKEQIKGLIETNKQLQVENQALRQNATPEVLASATQVNADELPSSTSS